MQPRSESCQDPIPSGWPALDELLGGGWPVGVLCEIRGRGRSSLALGAVRWAQRRGQPVAWVDEPGSFCPATGGVDLDRFDLVRPARRKGAALMVADLLLRSRSFGLVVLDVAGQGGGGPSVWFRLARQATGARCGLLLLAGPGCSLAGSAAALVLQVRLAPLEARSWEETPPPALDVQLVRRRGAAGGGRARLAGG